MCTSLEADEINHSKTIQCLTIKTHQTCQEGKCTLTNLVYWEVSWPMAVGLKLDEF